MGSNCLDRSLCVRIDELWFWFGQMPEKCGRVVVRALRYLLISQWVGGKGGLDREGRWGGQGTVCLCRGGIPCNRENCVYIRMGRGS